MAGKSARDRRRWLKREEVTDEDQVVIALRGL
jgi:hypothetical protein